MSLKLFGMLQIKIMCSLPLALLGGIAPNQVIARSEFEVHRSNLYGVNVTKAVIGAYM